MSDDGYDDDGRRQATDETDKEVIRLWRAWKTINEMCKDRVKAPHL
jgi:RNA polymerase Rpb5, N-terminal domain